MLLLGYLLIGAVAGLVAGIFGVGGGLIVVPVLIAVFQWQGVSPEIMTHMAVATSLATIFITSISSTISHHQHGAVLWRIFWFLSLGICFGAVIGVNIANLLPGDVLQRIIGGFAFLIALQLALDIKPKETKGRTPSGFALSMGGTVIGSASTIFGIGGGTLSVPYLSFNHVKIHQAVATSAACGIPIAFMGSLTNIVVGWQHPDLPDWSTGYIYWPAFCGIVLTSTVFARFGARMAHRLSPKRLKRLFAALLCVVGIRLIFFSS